MSNGSIDSVDYASHNLAELRVDITYNDFSSPSLTVKVLNQHFVKII